MLRSKEGRREICPYNSIQYFEGNLVLPLVVVQTIFQVVGADLVSAPDCPKTSIFNGVKSVSIEFV
jgi:hypothetical protein